MPIMTVNVRPPSRVAVAVSPPKKLFHLQALRGLAASLVVLAHSVDSLAARKLIPAEYADRLGISGYFGVATFFIISGFIIFKTSAKSFGGTRGSAGFMVKRLVRVFPVYWIGTAVFVALSPHRGEFTATDLLYSLFLVPHEIGTAGDLHPLVGQGWTLQYEILFYLIFASGLMLTRRAGLALIVASLLGLVAVGSMLMPVTSMAEPMTPLLFWTRPIMLLFVVGIGFGLLQERLPASVTVPRPFAVMLAVLGVWFAYSLMFPLSADELIRFPTVLVVWVLAAAWVFVSIFGRRRESWSESLAEQFGDASYSVYLFHTLILSALLRLRVQDISPLLFVLAALVGSNLFGAAIYRWVERPILRTLHPLVTFHLGSSVPRHPPAAPT